MAKKDRELEPWLQEQSTNPADYPTPEELGLNEPEEVSEDLVLGAGQALTGNFTIRTSKPASGDKYLKCYITKDAGGWSGAITGSPRDSVANVLANCVGYAQGRFCEVYNEITGSTGNKYSWLNCNAMYFIERIKNEHPGELEIVDYPVPGSILVMGNPDRAGHVIFVERVNSDGSIYTSESAYDGTAFYNKTRYYNDGHWGMNSNYYQRGFILNPAVTSETYVVDRDLYMDQLKSLDSLLRIRDAASLSGNIIGFMEEGCYYNNYETAEADGFTWYRIGEKAWCAAVEDTLEVLPAIRLDVDRNPKVNQLKSLDSTLRVRNAASLSGEFLTFMKEGCYYNNYESKDADGYTWFRIGKDAWCANVVDTLELLPAEKLYKVSVPASKYYTVKVDKTEAKKGDTVTVKVTPNEGYKLLSISANGEAVTNGKFIMPDKDVSIEVKVELIKYKVTVTKVDHVTVTVNKTLVAPGTEITVTAVPDAGYEVENILVNGAVIKGTTFTLGSTDAVVKATVKPIKYTITVKANEGGKITASKATASIGEKVTLTITPNDKFEVDTVTILGADLQQDSKGELFFIVGTAPVTVSVTFRAIIIPKHSVLLTTNGHCILEANKLEAEEGEEVQLNVKVEQGYKLKSLTVNNEPIKNYTFIMGTQDAKVIAEVKPIEYRITVADVPNGKITVDRTTASVGQKVIIKAIPEEAYKLVQIIVTGTQPAYDEDNNIFFNMPMMDVIVTAIFEFITQPKFQVGDKVKILAAGNSDPMGNGYTVFQIGNIATVSNIIWTDMMGLAEFCYQLQAWDGTALGFYREEDLELYHEYVPKKFQVGEQVKIKAKGNSRPDGSGYTVYGIGWKKEILGYVEGAEFPYKVGKAGTINIVQGYYREIDLESV